MKSQRIDEQIFPTTAVQQELFLHKVVNPESSLYNIVFLLQLPISVNEAIWKEALERTTTAHPILSSSIISNKDETVHLLPANPTIHFECFQSSFHSHEQLRRYLEELRQQSINYSSPPLIRHFLFHLDDNTDMVALLGPHILFDGYSAKIFFEQVSSLYLFIEKGSQIEQPHPPTFFDYARAMDRRFDQADTLNYWRQRLRHSCRKPASTGKNSGNHIQKNLTVTVDEYKKIKLFCSCHHIHLPTFFMGVYSLIADCYGERDGDLVIQTIIGLRDKSFLKTVGCFYHVIPYLFSNNLFGDRHETHTLFNHIEKYYKELQGRHLISSSALASIMGKNNVMHFFNFQRHLLPKIFGEKVTMEALWMHPEKEVHLLANDLGRRLELQFFYHENCWSDPDFLMRYRSVMHSLIQTGEIPDRASFLLPAEKQLIAKMAAHTEHKGAFRSVLDTIAAQADRTPEKEALCFEGASMSYKELLLAGSNCAEILASHGVEKGSHVGICLDPSPELVVGVLAIIMTGAAYVPLNTRYPPDRMRTIMEDAQPDIILTQSKYTDVFRDHFRLFHLDSCKDFHDSERSPELHVRVKEDDPVYIIYTSGTTGLPKGVVVTHGNVSRLFTTAVEHYQFDSNDRWTLFHSIAFDFSVWELFGALVHGGTLIVVPEEITRSPGRFYALACEQHATVLNQTPSAFYALQQCDQDQGGMLNSLRYLIFGGETLHLHKIKPWIDLHGYDHPEIFNMYGITETTVHVTCKRIQPVNEQEAVINRVGKPLGDLGIEIADDTLNPVPLGYPGEICICGAGVSQGYFNRADLTAKHFLQKTSLFKGARFYRSGDLGRILSDGELEHLGRIDKQLKIRGFRIEPGEIEATLIGHPAIREALVLTTDQIDPAEFESAETKLLAYITLHDQEKPSLKDLHFLLKDRLPDYMVPSAYVFLGQLPLTDNGKIDIQALPLPQRKHSLGSTFTAPKTSEERLLTQLFAETLQVDKVGRDDDFFQLGGHSLAVVRLAAQYRKKTGKDLALCAVFEHPTVAELADKLDIFSCEMPSPFAQNTTELGVSGEFALSHSQERVWSLIRTNPGNRSYEFLSLFEIWGPLRLDLLKKSLQTMVDRHEIYRTTFHEHKGKPYLKIHRHWQVSLHISRVLEKSDRNIRDQLIANAIADISRSPFRLDALPLARWSVVEVQKGHYIFLHFEHHLLHDGWSFVVFMQELFEIYTSLVEQRPATLAPLELNFSEFVVRQRHWLQSVENVQLKYWTELLTDANFTLPLPLDKPRPGHPSFTGEAIRFELPPEVKERISSVAKKFQSTVFMLMISAFAAMLAKHSRQHDLVVGTSFANRRWPESENLLGMLINNLPLRFTIDYGQTVSEFIGQVRDQVIAASEHQDIPFNRIVETLNPKRSSNLNPLFQTLFTAYEGPMPDLKLPEMKVQLVEGVNTGAAKFDLNVIAICRQMEENAVERNDSRQGVLLIWEYNADIFSETTMRAMLETYVRTIEFFVENPFAQLSKMCWPTKTESELLLDWGTNHSTYPRESSIHNLFTSVAKEYGEKIAIRMKEHKVSYAELEEMASTVASFLSSRNIGANSKVVVIGSRSPELIAAYLGILKAGGIYIPLDDRAPISRQNAIIKETGARMVLIAGRKLFSDSFTEIEFFTVAAILTSEKRWKSIEPPARDGSDPAYIMYTSGSTGRPKGVSIRHRGISRLVLNTDYVNLDNHPIVLHMAANSFDASTFEIWAPLLNGGTCVLYPEEVPSIDLLESTIRENAIDILWLTSSLFNMIIDTAPFCLSSVGQIIVGGEALSVRHMEKACRIFPDTLFINGYGPTENTTFSCCYRIPKNFSAARNVPIGRPIANSETYILDEWKNLLPPGVPGELCVSGDGLSTGYVDRPDLNNKKFVTADITLSSQKNSTTLRKKLYKTGDLARWMPDGNIEYLCRFDEQIKIRGFLVEPAEIRTTLNSHPSIRDSAVTFSDGPTGEARLVGYVCLKEDLEPGGTSGEIRAYLAGKLPDYMIPHTLVFIDSLPLNTNGKLDITVLPEPPRDIPQNDEISATSADGVSSSLANIWRNVLGLQSSPGLKDNFFDLGGTSLKMIQVHNAIQQQFGKVCTVLDLFTYPTLKDLAEFLDKEKAPKKLTEQINLRARKRNTARRGRLQHNQ